MARVEQSRPGRRAVRQAAAGAALCLLIGTAACGAAKPAGGSPTAGSSAAGGSTPAVKEPVVQGLVNAAYAATPPPLAGPASAWKTSETTADQSSDVLRDAADWKGATQASLDVYAMWDKTNLYIGTTVLQDHPYTNNYTAGNVWQGDAIWLYFTAALGASTNAAKLTLVQASDGPEVYDWLNNAQLTNVQMKLVTSGNQYWAAGAIPWSVLGVTPSAGMILGTNIGEGFGSSGFIDLNGKDPDNDTADDAPLTLQAPPA